MQTVTLYEAEDGTIEVHMPTGNVYTGTRDKVLLALTVFRTRMSKPETLTAIDNLIEELRR